MEGFKKSGVLINGMDSGLINEMIEDIRRNPENGRRTYKASSVWQESTRSESTIRDYKTIMDEPWGTEKGPQPGEMVLAALGACLVVGYTLDGVLHNIELKKLSIELEGDIELTMFLQIPSQVIPNFTTVRIKVDIESEASPDVLEEMHKRVMATTPVGSTLRNKSNLEFNLTANGVTRP